MMLARDPWIDDDGCLCEVTIDALMHAAAPANEWPATAEPIDWDDIPATAGELTRGTRALLDWLVDAELAQWHRERS